MRFPTIIATILCFVQIPALQSQNTTKTENVFIITLDGLRWQELFSGADDSLFNDTKYVKDTSTIRRKYWRPTAEERRSVLMPWVWNTIAKQGVILGNRNYNNNVNVTNLMWFSYPGYNEILVGYSDPNINSNDKINNPNITILEWLQQREGFGIKAAAFGSWDVIPYIINEERSQIAVNAGFEEANHFMMNEKEMLLNELQSQIPSPWHNVRHDGFTHHYAKEFIKTYYPNVVFISYGETDDFAHDSRYDHYLNSANNTDRLIKDLWEYCQSDSFYKDKTSFIITTDHGRGDKPKKEWTSHGKGVVGSNAIWMAAIGPDTPALGEVKSKGQHWQNQIATTVAKWMGFEYTSSEEVGKAIDLFYNKNK